VPRTIVRRRGSRKYRQQPDLERTGRATNEGTPVAFVIFSAGPVTHSRLRTVDALPLAAGVAMVLLLLMAGCFALGYGSAHTVVTQRSPDRAAVRLDLDRPEGRALIDRVGDLSGRLTLLESEAATLATRLGVGRPAAIRPAAQPPRNEAALSDPVTPDLRPADQLPRGGPFIPLSRDATRPIAGLARHGDLGTGLSRLENELARLEAVVVQLANLTIEHDLASMAFPSRRPIREGRTSSGFGTRRDPFTGRPARHEGLDFPAPVGTPILASAGGRVVVAGASGAYGNAVVIDHGNGLATLYGHASRIFVRPGDLVMPQQAIAAVGSTGRSTGAHLHFEVMRHGIRVEPRDYLARVDAPSALP
jgi:murein DD-endopeptidase MepM/ murein hydrolase activator NlpD